MIAMGGFTMEQGFVQAPEHRPKPTVIEASGIPVIDISPLLASSGDQAAHVDALAAEVGAACREWGFFVAVGHGVPAAIVSRAVAAQRAFFALPAERKAEVRRVEASPLGYYESGAHQEREGLEGGVRLRPARAAAGRRARAEQQVARGGSAGLQVNYMQPYEPA